MKHKIATSLVCYFDIYGFSALVKSQRQPQRLIDKIVKIWDWLDVEIKEESVRKYLFSDCGFITCDIDHDRQEISERSIHFIELLQRLLSELMKQDFFVRGAVTYGEIIYTDNLIIGEPVIKAVKYESQLCPAPFIMLPYETRLNLTNEYGLDLFIEKPKLMYLKNKIGVIKANAIMPIDTNLYLKKIMMKAQYYLEKDEYIYAKIWLSFHRFLEKTFILT